MADEAARDALRAAAAYAKVRNGEWSSSAFYQVALKELATVMAAPSGAETKRGP